MAYVYNSNEMGNSRCLAPKHRRSVDAAITRWSLLAIVDESGDAVFKHPCVDELVASQILRIQHTQLVCASAAMGRCYTQLVEGIDC